MSNYIGYKLEDNARRKMNNTGDSTETGCNSNVKSYSSKPGQLSAYQQADELTRKQQCLNKKQPVKVYTKEEIAQFEMKRTA